MPRPRKRPRKKIPQRQPETAWETRNDASTFYHNSGVLPTYPNQVNWGQFSGEVQYQQLPPQWQQKQSNILPPLPPPPPPRMETNHPLPGDGYGTSFYAPTQPNAFPDILPPPFHPSNFGQLSTFAIDPPLPPPPPPPPARLSNNQPVHENSNHNQEQLGGVSGLADKSRWHAQNRNSPVIALYNYGKTGNSHQGWLLPAPSDRPTGLPKAPNGSRPSSILPPSSAPEASQPVPPRKSSSNNNINSNTNGWVVRNMQEKNSEAMPKLLNGTTEARGSAGPLPNQGSLAVTAATTTTSAQNSAGSEYDSDMEMSDSDDTADSAQKPLTAVEEAAKAALKARRVAALKAKRNALQKKLASQKQRGAPLPVPVTEATEPVTTQRGQSRRKDTHVKVSSTAPKIMVSSNKGSQIAAATNETTSNELVQRRNTLREKIAKALRKKEELKAKSAAQTEKCNVVNDVPVAKKDVTTAASLEERTNKEDMQRKVVADHKALLARVQKLMSQQESRISEVGVEMVATERRIEELEEEERIAQEVLNNLPLTMNELNTRQSVLEELLQRNQAETAALLERYSLS